VWRPGSLKWRFAPVAHYGSHLSQKRRNTLPVNALLPTGRLDSDFSTLVLTLWIAL